VEPVVKTVDVDTGVREAFEFFTGAAATWWPPHQVIVAGERERIVFEPRVGGRWYESATDGAEADWGRVLAWEPPYRLAATWRIDGRWQHLPDDEGASEIEVSFTPLGPGRTRVQVAHVALERLGEAAAGMRAALDKPGLGATLGPYAAAL